MAKQGFVPLLLLTILFSCNQKDDGNSASKHPPATTLTTLNTAQDNVSITDLKPVSDDYKFPVIHFSKNKAAEEKINTYMQLEQLAHLPGIYKKDPFENIKPMDGRISGTTSFYGWNRNNTIPDVLSLSLNGEATGAYSEDFTSYYNFDIRTGNKILMKDIFTPAGLKVITKNLNLQVKKIIETHIAELEKTSPAQGYSTEEQEEQTELYKSCLEGVMDYNAEYYSFYFSNDSIIFERGRCSNHAMRALDELDKFDIPLAFSALKKHLTPYGENLLSGDRHPIVTTSPEGRLYKGFINGKYAIGAIFPAINDDGSFTMQYWYDKTKTPIEWYGTFKGQHFSMTEGDDAKIEADWINNKKIIGTWTNLKTNQALTLELEIY